MLAIAEKIIEQREGPFNPSDFTDRYEEALKALIEDKKKGHKPVTAEAPEDTNVVDLMAALRASLNAKGKAPTKPKAKTTKAAAPKAKSRKAS